MLPNMPKKDAAVEKHIQKAVATLQKGSWLMVPDAMLIAMYSEHDVADESLRPPQRTDMHQRPHNPLLWLVSYWLQL